MKNIQENESVILHTVKVSNKSVEVILTSELEISSRLLRKLSKSKAIYVDNKPIKLNKKLVKGDVITIIMEDENEPNTPQKLPIDIIYEDHDVIALNKQPYMVVHPTKSHKDNTIANGVSAYFQENGIHKKVRFINRLDMDTSGILLIAKNPFAHQNLSKQFDEDIVEKEYLVIVDGIVNLEEGIINYPIGKGPDNIKNVVTEEGKPSITKYTVLERYNSNTTLLSVQIKTGRTHQIRVHLKSIGHPVIGDSLYYKESDLISRQALHSHTLTFKKPRTGEKIKVIADLPEDMKSLIEKLK